MLLTVLAETIEGERRVALVPDGVRKLVGAGWTVAVQAGAGVAAGFPDDAYITAGATITTGVGDESDVVLGITPATDELDSGQTVVGMLDALWRADEMETLAARGVTAISLELVPRITRAQSMDVLSSTATVAGTEAVLLAARRLPKLLMLMMTAAGTVRPAQVLVVGAGVAGLQAIATAKRLGAVVHGYDVRPAAVEQIRSLGAKAVTVDVGASSAEDAGGYATEQDEAFLAQLQAQLVSRVSESDIVITTAAVPGARSPLIITTKTVETMQPGSVIVDLAAARGGNCQLTVADQEVEHHGVLVLGPTNLASDSPRTASEMFSNNVVALLNELAPEGELVLDVDNEVVAGVLVATGGQVVHPAIRRHLRAAREAQPQAATSRSSTRRPEDRA